MTGPGQLLPLRGYQREAVDAVFGAWANGMQRPAVVMATGLGKTVVFAHVAAQHVRETPSDCPYRALVLVHRDELVRQAVDKLHSVAPHLQIGVVKAAENDVDADVIVASVQTLVRKTRRDQLRDIGLVIVDECFPAGTLVGNRPIESLRPGDMVPSWDEITGQEVMRPVVALMRRAPSSMVRVTFDDGGSLDCTPNHPLLTDAGWLPAGWLPSGGCVVSFTHDSTAQNSDHDDLRGVREHFSDPDKSPQRYVETFGPDVLPDGVQGYVGDSGEFLTHGTDESGSRIGQDARPESDGARGCSRQDGGHVEAHQAQAPLPGWQRKARTGTAAYFGGVSRLAHGEYLGAEGWRETVPLQTGHRAPVNDGMRGGGRGIPLLAGPPSLRPTQGRKNVFRGVARVQILEPGSDGTYGGVCPDGSVYNIKVEGTHTYLVADGIVAHNCHHATAKSYLDVLDHFGCFDPRSGTYALGVTATMKRSDKVALGQVWQEVVYERDILWGIRHGYLVDVEGKTVRVEDMDMSGVRTSAGDYRAGDLGAAFEDSSAPQVIAKAYQEFSPGRPGVAFTPTVATAHQLAEVMSDAGISARAVDGAMAPADRAKVMRDYEAGEFDVLTNCMVATEGWDSARASTVVVARNTQSAPLYIQMVGRVLRPNRADPTKRALVLDVMGVSAKHSLVGISSLAGIDVADEETLLEAKDRLDAELVAQDERPAPEPRRVERVLAEDADLFHGSRFVWNRTNGGVAYVRAGDRYVVLVPEVSGAYAVAWMDQKTSGPSDWIVREISELSYAMTWGEEYAERNGDAVLNQKERAWRKKPATVKARALADKLRIIYPDDVRGGALADQIDQVFASQRIDRFVVPYLRKLGVTL